jgi:hypothetical protein
VIPQSNKQKWQSDRISKEPILSTDTMNSCSKTTQKHKPMGDARVNNSVTSMEITAA